MQKGDMIEVYFQKLVSVFAIAICIYTTGCETVSPSAVTAQPAAPVVEANRQQAYDISWRADNLRRAGKPDEALKELQMGLRLYPKSFVLLRGLGREYILLKQPEIAEKYLNEALEIDPNSMDVLALLSNVYEQMKRPQKSLEFILKAYQLLPEDADLANHVGWSYWGVGDYENAGVHFKRYLAVGSNRKEKYRSAYWMKQKNIPVPEYRNLAAVLLEQKSFKELDAHLDKLKVAKENDKEGDSVLTDAYDDMLALPKVGVLLDSWIESAPDSAMAKSVRGALWIEDAFNARGQGYGTTVTDQGHEKFKEGIAKARELLEASGALDAQNAETISRLMRVVKAEVAPKESGVELYRAGAAIDPDNYGIRNQMRAILAPRWGGSAAAELDFGREQVRSTDEKSKAPLVIVTAHWDLVESFTRDDAAKYFKDPAIWKECRDALEIVEKRFPESIQVRSMYIQTAYYAGAIDDARKQYQGVKDRLNLNYWHEPRTFIDVKRELVSGGK